MKIYSILIILFLGNALVNTGFKQMTRENVNLKSTPDSTRWVADPASKGLVNPAEGNKSAVKKGSALFKQRCVVCHGEKGYGDGPGSRALNPKPANLSSDLVQSQTDGEIFWKISEGRGPMITWKKVISEEDRWNLVNYVRTLKAN